MMAQSMTECLSDLRIDQWLAGELAVDEVEACEAHARACAACTERVATLRSFRSSFLEAMPAWQPPAREAAVAQPRVPHLTVIRGGKDDSVRNRARHASQAPVHVVRHAAESQDAESQDFASPGAAERRAETGPGMPERARPVASAAQVAAPAAVADHGRPRRFRLPAAGMATALAAAAAVLLLVRSQSGAPGVETGVETGAEPGAGQGTRTKGQARIGVFIEHEGRLRTGAAGEIVHPGDALQFVYSTTEPLYLALLGRDGAAHASIYFADGTRAARIEAGESIALPHSIVLDEVLGVEVFHALFCRTAIDVEPVRQRLQESAGPLVAPESCHVDTISFEKRR